MNWIDWLDDQLMTLAVDHRKRSLARRAARRHLATVTHALYSGSTAGYTMVPDLPREPNSTTVNW